jgi:NACHT domain
MRSIAGRRLAAVIALGTLAVCAFVVSRLMAEKGLAFAADVASIAAFVLAAAAPTVLLLRKLFSWLSGVSPVSKITLEEARSGLAKDLAKQLAEEDQLLQAVDPRLPVRWRQADGKTGRFTDIYETFAHTPARRMVILGAAGASKSVLAIKLVLDLLAREPGDRMPVLLSAASWTRDCTLNKWIAGQLAMSWPNLDVRISTGTGGKAWLPEEIANSGLIPVIDGLDELPRDRWTHVISEINRVGSEYPLVLTIRPEEYHAAVASRGISQAVAIELEPLEVPRSSSTSPRRPTRRLTGGGACSSSWTPSPAACSPRRWQPR